MAGDGDLVIRQQPLGRLLGSAPGVVWDVRGIAGAGKSVLLREVERQAARGDVVVLLEMQDYLTASGQGEIAGDPAGDISGELRRFGRALSAMISRLRDLSALARAAVEEILDSIGGAVGDAGRLSEAEAHERAGELIERIKEELNLLIAGRAATGGRMYLLADAFEVVIDRPLGEWFLRLLARLDGAVVAIARRTGDPGGPDLPGLPTAQVLEVGGLTQEEVSEYLGRRLGKLGTEIAAAVHGFTGGHALAVGLTADLASDMRRHGQADTADGPLGQLIEQLEQGRNDHPDTRLARLVTRFVKSAEEYDARIWKGLYCLLAVRRFDFPLLEQLVGAAGLADGWQLAERLVSYSFVERRTPPGRPADLYYVVHDRVRELWRKDLPRAKAFEDLLQQAEAYYRGKATETLDNYERWFRYEDPRWQTDAREWLYYVTQLPDDKRSPARRGLAKLFLDAFWWWGSYVSFPFCEELLIDWAEMVGSARGKGSEDWAWGERLRELYVRYPKGWRREEATTDDWEVLQGNILDFLENRPELRDKKDEDVRHIQGILKIYLADTERFLDPGSEDADEHLLEARDLFDRDDDAWNVAWVSFQRADAALWRGDAGGAVAAADEGWRDLTELEEDDFELAANLHRIHADAAWEGGERGLSLDLYARAALSAYKFQVAVGDPDITPIDEYTQAFMTEVHERAAERLSALHEDGDDQAVREACARIRQFFDPYWHATGQAALADLVSLVAEGRAVDVVGQLFPPAPAPADLHQPGTAYALTATKVLYKMRKELAKPPGTPLPHPPTEN